MKMKTILKISLLLLILLLAGCSANASNEDSLQLTLDFESAVGTAIVETIAAALPQTDENPLQVQPSITPVPQDSAVQVLMSTSTPEVIYAETSPATGINYTPTPTDLSTPCYMAELVGETIPDDTVFAPGTGFVKVWQIRNAGVCEWTEDFHWVLAEGEEFRGPTDLKLGRSVYPGEILEVKLELSTPNIPGTYEGIYKIETDEGALVTPNGFWIRVIIEDTEGS
ncbi:hypothetical protein KQH54_00405 [bacterium]|nr:hypothetical protein [bacterium]